MLGWRIFVHSVRLVLSNLDAALRVSGALYVVYAGGQAWFLIRFGEQIAMMQMGRSGGSLEQMPMMDSGYFGAALFSALITMVATLWIAVAWHRFVLLGEQPKGWLPVWQGDRVLAYFGRSLLIVIMAMLAALAFAVPLGIVFSMLQSGMLLNFIPMLAMIAGAYVFYRLSPILPAGAMDKPIKMGAAWAATKGQTGTIVGLAIITTVATLLMQVPSMMNSDPASIINIVYTLVVGWFMMLIGVSVLTTFYGHFIEGREVD